MDIQTTIKDFYSTLQDLINNLTMICPDTIIAKNKKDIDNMVSKDIDITLAIQGKNKFIDNFVLNVLKYKKDIEARNENFFLTNNYSSEINNNQDYMNKIFEFKTIWTTLNNTNKEYIFQYMSLLCILAENYFMIRYPAHN